ncbi:MAG: NAD(P)/FAD-dependent oxidoreductase [Gammaproteobacteria bacterium]|nr:NAD(P)/FAD-dependent oxidoreductase [Gammaproteobacteria bacterium]
MIQTDVVIIGAGPVGLFQVFELGLQGLSAHIVDSLEEAGGQCIELYPDKPIYDIPAIPVCSARELIDNLLEQIAPFDPQFHFGQQVTQLEKTADGQFRLLTSKNTEFLTRAVIIAAGAGSFTPVKLRVDGIDDYLDRQLFYRVKDPSAHYDKDVVILGGGDSALDWSLALYDKVKSLTLVHRTEKFRAAEASVNRMLALSAEGKIDFLTGRVQAFSQQDGRLQSVEVTLNDEQRSKRTLNADHLLVFFGMSPKLDALAEWGLELERNLICVDTEKFETNLPGVFAVGDINTYPGKKKLILSGFHETALAAFAIKDRLEPGKKHYLQYTTTSPLMHERLGVE